MPTEVNIYYVYTLNRVYSFCVFLIAFFFGFVVLCLLLDEYVQDEDLTAILLILFTALIGWFCHAFGRVMTSSRFTVAITDGQIILSKLTGFYQNKPDSSFLDTYIQLADILQCKLKYRRGNVISLKLSLINGKHIQWYGRIHFWSSLNKFEELAIGLSKGWDNTGKIQSIITPIREVASAVENTVAKTDSVISTNREEYAAPVLIKECYAKKIHNGFFVLFFLIALVNLFSIVIVCMLSLTSGSSLITFVTAVLGITEVVFVSWAMIFLITEQLKVLIYNDRVVIQPIRHILYNGREQEYYYKEIKEIDVYASNRGNTSLVIHSTSGFKYRFMEFTPFSSKVETTKYKLIASLTTAYNQYLSKYKTAGKVRRRSW